MMRFVVDAQLPPRLVQFLQAKRHEADHVRDVLGESASDRALVAHAKITGAILVSKDGDFVDLLDATPDAPQLLWVRAGNAANKTLIARLEPQWERAEAELLSGRAIVEIG